ncbi:MAG TPA: dTMP kinase [Holophagaceae bacterium]|nr:dTMP kinase [Holophagaceae bacterium]
MLVTFEGIEGSGKSTQLLRLSERLRRLGVSHIVTKEPGGTALGAELRRLLLVRHASGEAWAPESELLLFYADRAQHLKTVIRPALEAGQLVLVDRFEDSTRAYQGASGVSEDALNHLRDLVLQRLRPPLTVLLDLEPEQGLTRAGARNEALPGFQETRFDEAAVDYHRRVRQRFLQIAKEEPQRVCIVPARDEASAVEAGVWRAVSPLLRSAGFGVD